MEEKERYVIRYDLDYNRCLIDTEKIKGVGDYIQIVKLLNQQDKRIKELEEENGYILFKDGYDKDGNEIHKQVYTTYKEEFTRLVLENKKLMKENQQLKQQLAEKEQEIESLRENSLSKRIFKEKLIPSHCMEQYEKYEQQIDKLMQDKISFAIAELEKVKEFVNDIYGEYSASVTTNFIDNQINELKGDEVV